MRYILYGSRKSRNEKRTCATLPLPLSLFFSPFLRTPRDVCVSSSNVEMLSQLRKYVCILIPSLSKRDDDRTSSYRRSFSAATRFMPGKLQVAKVSYAHNVNEVHFIKVRERERRPPFSRLNRRVKQGLCPTVYDSGPQGRSKVAQ